jgi:iron(III) transport system permease protein
MAWMVLVLIVVVPFLSLAATALVPTYGVPLALETVTLDRFAEVLLRQGVTRRAFANSMLLALAAGFILAVVAVLLAYVLVRRAPGLRPTALALIDLPYAVPGVVVAIVCILLFLRPLPLIGISLYATPWIILAAYLIRFLALALKPTLAVMATLPIDTEEAAALSGARLRARLWYVVLPALLPAATAGGLMVFLLAFNELTVSALLWSAGTETLGVALLSLEDAGLGAEAAAVGVAVTVIVSGLVLALDAVRDRLPPDALPWTALSGR